MNILKNITIGLSIAMCIPTLIALYGIQIYLTHDKQSIEPLYISTYMVYFSAVIYLPYIVIIKTMQHNLTRKIKLYSPLPFILMLLIILYITNEGVPW